jgi:cyclophilin family peptidyl-prolyl cis-trans isomerase/protein-disulfide isomerase
MQGCLMRKFVLLLIALVSFSAACSPATSAAAPTHSPDVPPGKATPDISETCYSLRRPTPNPNEPSLFAPVTQQDHIQGPADAYLTIVEYSDFQCPSCAKFATLLAKIQQEHPRDIRIVYRNFPLITVNDKAALSTQAAEAAGLQGKFWEMHDLLFEKQAEWTKLDTTKFPAWVVEQAGLLGLDKARFTSDLTSPEIVAIPQKAWEDGTKIQLPGTPLILVNGEILKWQPTLLDSLEEIIRLDLLPKRQFDGCPPLVIDSSKQYSATLKTIRGDIVIRLFADKAPSTVNNFVFLAQKGWYDHVTFYRVIPGFVAQSGDPSGTGQGNPGYFIADEIDPTLQFDRPGLLGMNNSGPDTNGSQFFITYAAASSLNGKYTIFGQVTSGLDVLKILTSRDPKPGENLPDGDLLITITIEEK